jgi:MscS family membrane protein
MISLADYSPYLSNQYVQSLIIFIGFIILAKIIQVISTRYILKLTAKTKTTLDDILVHTSSKVIIYFISLLGLKIALNPLGLPRFDLISKFIDSLIIVLITYSVIKLINIFIEYWGTEFSKRTKSHMDDALLPLFHKFAKVSTVIVVGIVILGKWGIEIAPFLASLGIAGIAIGFAVKDSLANIFGGISLILDKSFKVGDKIKLVDDNLVGTIQNIGLRSTKLKTFDNEIIIIPNGQMANAKVQNYRFPDLSVRVVVKFGVEYGTEVEKVKKVVTDAMKTLPNALKDPEPDVKFSEMADFALLFKARFWVADYGEAFLAKEEANCKIYDALNKAKIGIPFPTSTVHLKK